MRPGGIKGPVSPCPGLSLDCRRMMWVFSPQLIPLFMFVGLGGVGSLLYALRVATTSPEVAWDKKNNPDPWNRKSPNYQYKV